MKRIMMFALFIVAALLLTGCFEPAKYTGGGSLDSVVCGEKANVGFVFNGCKEEPTANFVYQDKADGVKMKGGEILEWSPFSNELKLTYTSMNKDYPGDGVVKITVGDWGEGNEPHGFVKIKVKSGPYDDYENWAIIDGNVQRHECNDDD